jgi:DHA1 family multidrug resistance protein-like MFS transporter
MAVALLCAGISIILQGLPHDLYLFAAMQFVGGLFFCGIHPSINAVLAASTPPEVKGRIFGLLFSAQQVGSMAGPILGGLIATVCGMQYVFFSAGVILIFLSLQVYRQFIVPANA